MSSNSKVVLGIITAAAVGAVIGMLFAPEKGTELREKVRGTANDLASDLLDAVQKGRQQYTNAGEEIGNAAQNLKSKAAGKLAEGKDFLENAIDDAKNKAQQAFS